MDDGDRIKELQRLMKNSGIKKPKYEVPLDNRVETQCFASITGCCVDPVIDPADIYEEEN